MTIRSGDKYNSTLVKRSVGKQRQMNNLEQQVISNAQMQQLSGHPMSAKNTTDAKKNIF